MRIPSTGLSCSSSANRYARPLESRASASRQRGRSKEVDRHAGVTPDICRQHRPSAFMATNMCTGYGRVSFPQNRVVTEITCQAKGCHYFFPEVPYILDLGGQDAKVIKKNAQGKVVSFVMNDKCAAGTGRFLDVIFRGLDLRPEDTDPAAEVEPVPINSMCTVFVESEVIIYLSLCPRFPIPCLPHFSCSLL
ncbi:activator of (R)-2-hydroxyglutaryl-CoA dehydratase [Peptococcaceae bacterium CEB3]|nr:activator of (R)-2-hydroxyglutaryl-CoA dehydratase [Peptococcaceae bacterium CEB3]